MQQILAFETILKLAGGLVLLLVPLTTARVIGLPRPQSGFWPRLLGGVLIGIAGGTYLELVKHTGISVPACIIINFIGAGTVVGLLVMKGGGDTWRGRAALVVLAVLLMGLVLIEIAYI